MWTIPKNLSSNQNDFHVNMIKTNVNLYIISHKIMIKYWQNAIGSIQKSIFFYKHCKNDNFFETSYDATTKPSLNFSVVVPKLFKQKTQRETTQKRAFFLKRFYSVISWN